ncbi:Bis(5'-nucleosyl)-tetraphosphatase [Parachlamydia acanthamoebae]|uniref:Bis(5'-nucleosyl)-tetraphosphatase n=2 Tax=Parachlamydia acanthamoebae TaxID=83552 RepID=A0A0C1C6R7_9BACT|nr:Bis(5'-nucleosyl)-tetraphosphatase [Parachlamydia acanthamoebae]
MQPRSFCMQTFQVAPITITAFIIKKAEPYDQYLILRRCSSHFFGSWQPVTGGIEDGETAWEAALREIQEETDLQPDRFYAGEVVEIYYEVYRNAVVTVPVFVAFIDSPQEVATSPTEHDAFLWLPYEEAFSYLEFAEQRRALTYVHENFIRRKPSELLRIEIPQSVG